MFFEKQSLSPAVQYVVGFFGIFSFAVIILAFRNYMGLTPPDRAILAISSVAVASIFSLVVSLRMHTTVSDGSLNVRFWPFGCLTIPIADVKQSELIQYDPLSDFGGWGVRPGLGGIIYSVRGRSAVKIVRNGGSLIYIGTGKPEELLQSIRN